MGEIMQLWTECQILISRRSRHRETTSSCPSSFRYCLLGLIVVLGCAGCWAAAGAAGAEAGYVASQDRRSAGETIDDQVLHTALKSKLLADPTVSGLAINVDVFRGDVTLRGYVRTQKEIDRALEIVRNTSGVRSIDSRLVLDRP